MQWDTIIKDISDSTQHPFDVQTSRSIGGGSINDAYLISNGVENYFVKLNSPTQGEMFAAEAEGLLEINNASAIRAPEPVCWGSDKQYSYIVMEYIELGGRGSQRQLGEQLAGLHRYTSNTFGWHRDNTIGSTPQKNPASHNWVSFFRDQRLGFQLELAAQQGYRGRLQKDGELLLNNLEQFFTDYSPVASLLHGDLWSGNYSFDATGAPVIFDPASYYGDREADIAMTELFGGFGPEFYASYNERYPLNDTYPIRKTLYNLYHIINHINLFGSGYQGQAESMLGKLLAEIR